MSRAPLFFSLTALAVGAGVAALPAGATPPGANGKLVFERPTRDGVDLYTVNANGSGLTQLTRLQGLEGLASWSPDGSKVAFTRARNPERGPFEIWVVNADGTGLRRVTRHHEFSLSPAWSPDGRQIAYQVEGRGQPPELFVANSDGSGARRLASRRNRGYTDPSWSPDGTRIAFTILRVTDREFDSSIAVIDADDGGNLRRLTRPGGPDELHPNWSPDSTAIAFERNKFIDRRQSDIWMMAADGSAKRRITATRFHETTPTFSPDGTRIAFTSDRDNRRLSKNWLGRGFELYTMALDGSSIVRVTANRRPDLFPDWQPLP